MHGVGKFCDFRLKSLFNLGNVNTKSYALYRLATLMDPNPGFKVTVSRILKKGAF